MTFELGQTVRWVDGSLYSNGTVINFNAKIVIVYKVMIEQERDELVVLNIEETKWKEQ